MNQPHWIVESLAILLSLSWENSVLATSGGSGRSEAQLQKGWKHHKTEFRDELLPCLQMFSVDRDILVPHSDAETPEATLWYADLSRPRHFHLLAGRKKGTFTISVPIDVVYDHAKTETPPAVIELWREYGAREGSEEQVLTEDYSASIDEMMGQLRDYIAARLDGVQSDSKNASSLSDQFKRNCSGVKSLKIKRALQRLMERLAGH